MSKLVRVDLGDLCGMVGIGWSQYQLHKTRTFQTVCNTYRAKEEEAAACLRASESRGMNLTGHVACIGIGKYSQNARLGN